MVDGRDRDALEARFLKLEARVRAERRKWNQTRVPERRLMVSEFPTFTGTGAMFAWTQWQGVTPAGYPAFTAEAAARAALACCPKAHVTLTVDGLKPSERSDFSAALRKHQVRFRRIRLNARDEAYA